MSQNLIKKSVPVYEQETHVSYMRDQDFAEIYTSDSTQITRLDKLCKESPEMYSLKYETTFSKTYIVKDKKLISFRKSKKVMSDEQKQKAAERMRKWQQENK